MFVWLGVSAAFLAALLLTPPAIKIAVKLNVVDKPEARKVHSEPKPRMGGIAIYAAFAIGVLLLSEYTMPVACLLVSSGLVMLTGLIDDIRGISPRAKLLGQVIAALVLVQGGVAIRFITNPFDGGLISLGVFAIPLTVLWLVGVSNTINLVDGLDGLSAGISAIAALSMAIVCSAQGEYVAAAIAGVLAASCFGFLRYNFNPARTFMGDCGSLFLGFVLGALALMGLAKGATFISVFIPLIVLGIPIFDTFFAIVRRLILHKPVFEADKMHLHHRLLSLGLTHKQTVLTIYAVSLVMGLCAVLMSVLASAQAVIVLIIVTLLAVLGAERLGVLRGNVNIASQATTKTSHN
ncbi:MAG: MraY family glycosyltransferase [Bacillota bacterium]|nr:MraY family glycosyltransferase [Bacillota bacterium]